MGNHDSYSDSAVLSNCSKSPRFTSHSRVTLPRKAPRGEVAYTAEVGEVAEWSLLVWLSLTIDATSTRIEGSAKKSERKCLV
jgi:hypothetical protein